MVLQRNIVAMWSFFLRHLAISDLKKTQEGKVYTAGHKYSTYMDV